jgi:hypothetical protein
MVLLLTSFIIALPVLSKNDVFVKASCRRALGYDSLEKTSGHRNALIIAKRHVSYRISEYVAAICTFMICRNTILESSNIFRVINWEVFF